jgi:hypothetical protein
MKGPWLYGGKCIILGLLGAICIGLVFIILVLNPGLGFNPFPPPTKVPTVSLPTGTPTARIVLDPTWTSTPLLESTHTSTPRPSNTPLPTATQSNTTIIPVPTRPVLAFLNVNNVFQSDGDILTKAELSLEPIGIGNLELTAPSKIKLGESGLIRLSIKPEQKLLELPRVIVPTIGADQPVSYTLQINDKIQMYPIMVAELHGINIDIAPSGRLERGVTSSSTVEWVWTIKPKSLGLQSLAITISIPVIYDAETGEKVTHTLKDLALVIIADEYPTIIPTSTPQITSTPIPTITLTPTLSVIRRIEEQLISGSTEIFLVLLSAFGAGITGIGGLFIAYVKRQDKIKDLQRQLARVKTKKEKEQINDDIARLKEAKWWQFWK